MVMALGRWLRSRVVVAVIFVFACLAFFLHGVERKVENVSTVRDTLSTKVDEE